MPLGSTATDLDVALSDRWALVGMTGCGKTTLARLLLKRYRQLWPSVAVYVLDSKASGDFASWRGLVKRDSAPPALTGVGGVQVWQPAADDRSEYDEWLGRILHAHTRERPAVVLVDELSSLGGRSGQTYPVNLSRLLKQGRGLGISLVVLTQEAAYIPRQVLGQTTHLVRFRLLDELDARRLDRLVHGNAQAAREPAAEHGFFYRRLDQMSAAREFADARAFLG